MWIFHEAKLYLSGIEWRRYAQRGTAAISVCVGGSWAAMQLEMPPNWLLAVALASGLTYAWMQLTVRREPKAPRGSDFTFHPGPMVPMAAIAAASITAVALPFLQAISTRAGNSVMDAMRDRRLRRRLRKQIPRTGEAEIRIVDQETGRSFDIPADLPLDALAALANLTTEQIERMGAPDLMGREVSMRWDVASGTWVRKVNPRRLW